MANDGILLESGTNEVEILEFMVGGQSFGVNVLKIQTIEQFDPEQVTTIHNSHPSVVGALSFRDRCITLIDLAHEMGGDLDTDTQEPTRLVLVMDFNGLRTAFLVDGVDRIRRVSWDVISSLSPVLSGADCKFTGSLDIEGREILIVDMERIVTEILPDSATDTAAASPASESRTRAREKKTIFVAEDSTVIRERVRQELAASNYVDVRTFATGRDCYDAIEESHRQARSQGLDIAEHVAAVVTDIEMPVMDGFTLCRVVKETLDLNGLPVIMFSSMVNDQITEKCSAVGADACIAKPEFSRLIALLDRHCGLEAPAEV